MAVAELTALARAATPCPVDGLPTLAERVDWLGEVPHRLAAAGWLHGNTLIHGDLRADDLLLGPGAQWPSSTGRRISSSPPLAGSRRDPGRGRTQGDVNPEWLVGGSPLVAAADPRQVTDLVLAMAGMWAATMRRPAPPGLPTIRAFQRHFHGAALAWGIRRVAARLG